MKHKSVHPAQNQTQGDRTNRAWPTLFTCLLLLSVGCSSTGPDSAVSMNPAPLLVEPETPSSLAADQEATDDLLNRGLEAHVERRFDDARALYLEVLAADESNVFARYNLGLLAHTEGDLEGAKEAYRATLAVDPSYVPALFNLGIVSTSQGDTVQAMELYRLVVTLDESNASAHLNLGILLYGSGDQENGLVEINRAYELDPAIVAAADPT